MRTQELYRAMQLPVFQNRMFDTAEEASNCPRGDVVLVRDLDTGLIFNQTFRPELMAYDANYQNEQAVSAVFRTHLDEVADIAARNFTGQTLIEVGCGKGHFLEHLSARGFQITGLDPTYEGDNPQVVKAYFTPQIGLSAQGILLRHVLEHVRDPVEFLAQILEANGGAGKIYIEVPCFDWICARRAWFDVFYEHANYFRANDFLRMFATVYEAGHCFGGQYLYVVADLASLRRPALASSDDFAFPGNFLATVDRFAAMLNASAHQAVVWGGASKGVIFSLYMQRAGATIDFVIDINPAKQGKFLAATGLLVHAPEQALAHIAPGSPLFVMNSNYLPEIRLMTSNQFNYLTVDHENL